MTQHHVGKVKHLLDLKDAVGTPANVISCKDQRKSVEKCSLTMHHHAAPQGGKIGNLKKSYNRFCLETKQIKGKKKESCRLCSYAEDKCPHKQNCVCTFVNPSSVHRTQLRLTRLYRIFDAEH